MHLSHKMEIATNLWISMAVLVGWNGVDNFESIQATKWNKMDGQFTTGHRCSGPLLRLFGLWHK